LPYYVRPMRKEDIAQVNDIDREVFPTQLPPPNYRHELQNKLARYIVVCDEDKTVEGPEVKAATGVVSRVKQLLNSVLFPGDKLPPSEREYVSGFAGIWVMADEAHITNIAVRESYQRQGIGELLLISIIELAEELKASIITLEVRASNSTAQNLYAKYGFAQVGMRRSYYTDNREDGLIMTTESITSASFRTHFQRLKQDYFKKYGTASNPLARSKGNIF